MQFQLPLFQTAMSPASHALNMRPEPNDSHETEPGERDERLSQKYEKTIL